MRRETPIKTLKYEAGNGNGSTTVEPGEYLIPPVAIPGIHLSSEYAFASQGQFVTVENLAAFIQTGWLEESIEEIFDAVGGEANFLRLVEEKYQTERELRQDFEDNALRELEPYERSLPQEFFRPIHPTKSAARLTGKMKKKTGNDIATFVDGPLPYHDTVGRALRFKFALSYVPYESYDPVKERSEELYDTYLRRLASIAIGVSVDSNVIQSSFASNIAKIKSLNTKFVREEIESVPLLLDYVAPSQRNIYLRKVLEAGTKQ